MKFEDEEEAPKPAAGGAGWIMTFADLMSLLMCFFVLLLSFAEMDVQKFRRLAGSMSVAFGVQRDIRAVEVPKGTSVIAQEFTPGRPDPTPINEVRQRTSDETRESLDVACQDTGSSNSGERGDAQKLIVLNEVKDLVGETEQDAVELANALAKEIHDELLEVETEGRRIVLRIREYGTFGSGSAELARDFMPVIDKIAKVLKTTEGDIDVQGHTDDIPIATARFRSNWELSSSRAVSVAHALFNGHDLKQERFAVMGFGDTKALESNQTPEGRVRNRRVEIVIRQGLPDQVQDELRALQKDDPAAFREVQEQLVYKFNLRPDEIF